MYQSQGYLYDYDIYPFLKDYKSKKLLTLCTTFNGTYSSACNISMHSSMLGMIGETYERGALTLDATLDNKATVQDCIYFDLYDKNMRCLSNEEKRYLQLYFLDSCGMATHINSKCCIENAFSEFVERQSFMLSYLSKRPAKVLRKDSFLLSFVPKYYHFVDIYDISLVDSYKVYFAFAVKNDIVYCALGAGFTSVQALQKVIKELSISEFKQGSIKAKEGMKKDYIHLFHMLTIDRIVQAYAYLKNSEEIVFTSSEEYSLHQVVGDLYQKYKMRPLLSGLYYANYSRSILRYAKNVKIFALGWFPALQVNVIPSAIFDNIEQNAQVKLTRQSNFIPFP